MNTDTREAAVLAAQMLKEKPDAFALFARYVHLLTKMNGGEYPEAERLNEEMQARMTSGQLTRKENEEYLARIEAALSIC